MKVDNSYIIDEEKILAHLRTQAEEEQRALSDINTLEESKKIKYSLDGLLNDYYEDKLDKLPSTQREEVRKFIEEGLLSESGRRIGVYEETLFGSKDEEATALQKHTRTTIDRTIIKQLLDSRLIRVELTHLGRSYEVSHDTLVEPILKSRRERKAKEELEAKEQELKRQATELRASRNRVIQVGILATVGLGLAIIAFIFAFRANQEKQKTEKANEDLTTVRDSLIKSRDRITLLLDEYKNGQLQTATERYKRYISNGQSSIRSGAFDQAVIELNLAQETMNNYFEDNEGSTRADSIKFGPIYADSLITIAQKRQGSAQVFKSYIERGDRFMQRGPKFYVDAKRSYQNARQTNFNNTIANSRLEEIEGKLNLAYENFIKDGNIFYDAGGCKEALESYLQAQRIKEVNTTIQKRINECK